MTQSSASLLKMLIVALGFALLGFGLIVVIYYIPRSSIELSEISLLRNLAFIGLGLALELMGLGLVVLGRK